MHTALHTNKPSPSKVFISDVKATCLCYPYVMNGFIH